MLRGLRPGSLAELDIRAARARRRSRSRRARVRARARRRRSVRRVVITTSATLVATLAVVAGPESASIIRRQFAGMPQCPIPDRLRPAFLDASHAAGVKLPLLAAVAHTESRFDPGARSTAGAVGVLQVMPTTAAALHYDPEETNANIMAGAVYLKQLMSRFGSLELALAAYNAGPTAVDREGPKPTAETVAYVEQVLATLHEYGDCS